VTSTLYFPVVWNFTSVINRPWQSRLTMQAAVALAGVLRIGGSISRGFSESNSMGAESLAFFFRSSFSAILSPLPVHGPHDKVEAKTSAPSSFEIPKETGYFFSSFFCGCLEASTVFLLLPALAVSPRVSRILSHNPLAREWRPPPFLVASSFRVLQHAPPLPVLVAESAPFFHVPSKIVVPFSHPMPPFPRFGMRASGTIFILPCFPFFRS